MDTDPTRVRNPQGGGTVSVNWYIADGSANSADVADYEALNLIPRNLTAIKPNKMARIESVPGFNIHC